MKKFLLTSLVMASLFSVSSNSFGQSAEEQISDMKVFGMGMHIEQFKLNDIVMDISAPSNKIIFTITPSNNIRIEPEIGFSFYNDKENKLKDKTIHLGLGGFGMYQKGKTNIYGGLRFEYSKFTNEFNNWETDATETEETNGIGIGPAIGVEYFFSQHFSIGGEIGIKFMNYNTTNSQYTSEEDSKESLLKTDSGLLLRFYF
jgi:hypothetical protein